MGAIVDAGLARLLATLGVVVAVLLAHMAVWRLVLRMLADRALAAELHARCRWPARLVVALTAALLLLPAARLRPGVHADVAHLLLVGLIAATAWLAGRVVRMAEAALLRHYDVDVPDNLRARRARTQVRVLGRVVVVAITLVALAVMLLTLPQGRAIGTSLLASAGIAGVVAGVAARSTVGNLVAGLQIAFAEPIRLGDAVVVEGEWGHVEEITLTYVVVGIWDRRRLVLPCSYFVEHPIQNWTRSSSEILGAVLLHVDYATSVELVRAEFERVAAASPLWNRQTAVLQVVDATERTMVLRALVSADSATAAWDLRCEVRERLLAWLRREHPESLPRLRAELRAPAPDGAPDGTPDGTPDGAGGPQEDEGAGAGRAGA